MNSGTGTDPSTDRCEDCGHLLDAGCADFCCPTPPERVAFRRWISYAL